MKGKMIYEEELKQIPHIVKSFRYAREREAFKSETRLFLRLAKGLRHLGCSLEDTGFLASAFSEYLFAPAIIDCFGIDDDERDRFENKLRAGLSEYYKTNRLRGNMITSRLRSFEYLPGAVQTEELKALHHEIWKMMSGYKSSYADSLVHGCWNAYLYVFRGVRKQPFGKTLESNNRYYYAWLEYKIRVMHKMTGFVAQVCHEIVKHA